MSDLFAMPAWQPLVAYPKLLDWSKLPINYVRSFFKHKPLLKYMKISNFIFVQSWEATPKIYENFKMHFCSIARRALYSLPWTGWQPMHRLAYRVTHSIMFNPVQNTFPMVVDFKELTKISSLYMGCYKKLYQQVA